jgi:hypothetical protein
MVHTHSHHRQEYYIDQLCMIGISGALGGIALMLYLRDLLFFLADRFQVMVLFGGIMLLALVGIRAVMLWLAAGRAESVAEDDDDTSRHEQADGHVHTAACIRVGACPHGPAGHEHGWAPWRYVLLLFPVVLYFLGLPNEGFSVAYAAPVEETPKELESKALTVGYRELEFAGKTPESRASYEGATVHIIGRVAPGYTDRAFILVWFKLTCCGADALAFTAQVIIDLRSEEKLPPGLEQQWVEVTGQLQFFPQRHRPGNYTTVIYLRPTPEKPLGNFLKVLPGPPAKKFQD